MVSNNRSNWAECMRADRYSVEFIFIHLINAEYQKSIQNHDVCLCEHDSFQTVLPMESTFDKYVTVSQC